jgi:hypothetical protein
MPFSLKKDERVKNVGLPSVSNFPPSFGKLKTDEHSVLLLAAFTYTNNNNASFECASTTTTTTTTVQHLPSRKLLSFVVRLNKGICFISTFKVFEIGSFKS